MDPPVSPDGTEVPEVVIDDIGTGFPAGGVDGHADSGEVSPRIIAMLWEREHRVTHIVMNLLASRDFPRDDPRVSAARRAVVWRMLFSPAGIAVFGGLAAVATVVLMMLQLFAMRVQNDKFDAQNVLIGEQNSFFQEQNRQLREQIKSSSTRAQLAARLENDRRRTELVRFRWTESEDGNQSSRIAFGRKLWLNLLPPRSSMEPRRLSWMGRDWMD